MLIFSFNPRGAHDACLALAGPRRRPSLACRIGTEGLSSRDPMADPTQDRPTDERPTAVLVAVRLPGVTEEQHAGDLAELSRLVTTLGLRVVGRVTQSLTRLSPATVLGGGKLQELAAWTGGDGKVDAPIPSRERAQARRERLEARDGETGDEGDDAASLEDRDREDRKSVV